MNPRVIHFLVTLAAVPGCSAGLQVHSPLNSTPLEERVPAQYKKEVAFVQDVRRFAIEHLGMEQDSKHYTWFTEKQDNGHTLYILSITEKTILPTSRIAKVEELDKLSAYRADIKEFLYLESEVDTLEDERDYYNKKGYDTNWRSVTDYHTYGGKEGSPITLDFLKSTPEYQAKVVVHELCHGFVEKNIKAGFASSLDESFCSMVGYAGAAEYFTYKNLPEEHTKAVKAFDHYHTFAEKFVVSFEKLQRLYHEGLSQDEMLKRRAALFAEAEEFMGGEVNNALMWSWHPYLFNYPLMHTVYTVQGDSVPKIMQKMRHCPENEEKALKYIQELAK
ncbi:MAG: aminopeptidase [Nanoarchaeota archaeon]|nr:aminopeptidase [Nanoarchaeota archaeon]